MFPIVLWVLMGVAQDLALGRVFDSHRDPCPFLASFLNALVHLA